METWSRVRHRKVKAVEVVRGAGIGGGDVIVVEEDVGGRLLGLNRYRIAARVSELRVEGDWPRRQEPLRVAFEQVDGVYPDVEVRFCPSCEETPVVIVVGGGGPKRPADSSPSSAPP